MGTSKGMIPSGHMSAPKGYSTGAHGHGGHHRKDVKPVASNHMANPHVVDADKDGM